MKSRSTYTHLDALFASPDKPLPPEKQRHQVTLMWAGVVALENDERPKYHHWSVCSDAVNLMQTLCELGYTEDASGLLLDAVKALAESGQRSLGGGSLQMALHESRAVRSVLEDYQSAMEVLSARTMIHCHRVTEKRIKEILAGAKRVGDINVGEEAK
jgi:hypothetical protein